MNHESKSHYPYVMISTACPPGFFGIDCINRCDIYCSEDGSCDPVMGICIKGCKLGWSGLMCETRYTGGHAVEIMT